MSFDKFLEQDLNWERTYPILKEGEPRLTIEAIPTGAFFINLRSKLSKKDWDLIRKDTYQNANYKCEICGGKGPNHPVECHEIWEWDLETKTQTLIRCAALCPMCHAAKHPGQAERDGKKEKVFKYLMEMNDWDTDQFLDYFHELTTLYIDLNAVQNWKLNIKWAHNKLREIKECT